VSEDEHNVLLVEQLGAVRRLTLNRPEKRNALSSSLLLRLYQEISSASADKRTSVVVIRGAGSCFSAGFDMSGEGTGETPTAPEEDLAYRDQALEMNRIWNCPIPIIAQVHGWCLAGATDLVLSCDLILASKSAQLGHPGVRTQGTPPINLWLYYAGPQLAKWLLLTGLYVSGEEAASRGLALSVHDDDALEDAVLEAAKQIALIGRDILIANKAVLNFGIDQMGRAQVQRFAAAQDAIAHHSADSIKFRTRIQEIGLTRALAERNAKYSPVSSIAASEVNK